MRLEQLHTLIAIAESGSLRSAARRLGQTQPALTKAVARLEAELGAQLLQRTARGATLTQAGEVVCERGRLIQVELDRLRAEVTQQGGGEVRIGMTASAAFLMMRTVLRGFERRFPAATLKVVDSATNAAFGALRGGALDFIIAPLSPLGEGGDLKAKPLFRGRMVPVVRRGHPQAEATQLAALTQARWTWPDTGGLGLAAQTFRMHGLAPPRGVVADSFSVRLNLILSCDCVALLPERLVRAAPFCDVLSVVPIAEASAEAEYMLFQRAASPLSPAAAVLAAEFLRVSRSLRPGNTTLATAR